MFKLSTQCIYSKYILHLNRHNRSIRYSSRKPFQSSKVYLAKYGSLMKKDGLPQEYELIYRAPMELYISIAKNVSTITAILISTAAAYTATNQFKLPEPSYDSFGLVSEPNDIWYFSFGFIMVTVMIRIFVARYPLRIYRADDKYVAIYDSQFPSRMFKHVFYKGEVGEFHSKINPWSDCTYRLGNRTSLLLSRYFRTPADYNQMLGYN